jgi:prepilin-type N-terminal cleavage/methylation domain-containing protein
MQKKTLGTSYVHRGFSLIEMMMAFAVMMTLAGFAIPNIVTALNNMRLRGAASEFSGLAQRARITAVQHNATYTIAFGLPTGNGAYAYASSGSSTYSASDETVQFGGSVNQVAAPGGTLGKPTNLDASGGPLGWTATSGNTSFNSRGLPCNSATTPCGANVNYIFYFSDTRAFGGSGWAAVSISAAGHPTQWFWNGSSWIN